MGTATHSARHKQNHSLKKVTRIDMGTATYSNIQGTLFLLDKMHCNREPRCYSGFDKIRLFMEITTPSLCHIWIVQLLCTRIPCVQPPKKTTLVLCTRVRHGPGTGPVTWLQSFSIDLEMLPTSVFIHTWYHSKNSEVLCVPWYVLCVSDTVTQIEQTRYTFC